MDEHEQSSRRRNIVLAVVVTLAVLLVAGGIVWYTGGGGEVGTADVEAHFTSVEPPNQGAAEVGRLALAWAQFFGYDSARVTGYYDAGPSAEPYGCGTDRNAVVVEARLGETNRHQLRFCCGENGCEYMEPVILEGGTVLLGR